MYALELRASPMNRARPAMRRFSRGRRPGFTLIEVLMVVAVLAIIAGVVLPEVNSAVDEARNAAVLKDLHEFTFAIERYRADHNGATPDQFQDGLLVQLLQSTDQDGNVGSAGPQYPLGPYLVTVPRNALNGVTRVYRINTAPPADLSNRVGWVYHPASGQIWAGLYPDVVDPALLQGDGSQGGS